MTGEWKSFIESAAIIAGILSIVATGAAMFWRVGKWAGIIHSDISSVKDALHEHIETNKDAHQVIFDKLDDVSKDVNDMRPKIAVLEERDRVKHQQDS